MVQHDRVADVATVGGRGRGQFASSREQAGRGSQLGQVTHIERDDARPAAEGWRPARASAVSSTTGQQPRGDVDRMLTVPPPSRRPWW
ncbi:hypothetical protein [Streptomyces sp. NPDC127190]|uniref:hypothetical protein n=1 Tax=unclassified Streptomyces TaxID=2593676 RepID=UPI003626514C